jgi:hypothetical protein
MKKVIIAMLIALVIPCCIFAGRGLFDLTLGAVAQSSYDIEDVKSGELKNFDIKNLAFGADVEAKLSILAIDAKGLYDNANKGLSGIVSANLALDIFFVRVKAGLGYEYAYNFETKAFYFGNGNEYATEFANFKDAAFDINVGVDVLLGPITVGAYATLPTETSISNGRWDKFFGAFSNWEQAKLGLTVGFAVL